jgi:tetratricopeptide (TPR) repeat protein
MLAASTPAAAAVPSTALDDEWVEARTQHFTVFSNAGSQRAEEVGQALERLCEVFTATNPGLRATSPRPTDVYAFKDEASFKPYLPSRTEDISGWYQSGTDRDMIAFNLAPPTGEWTEVPFHEYTHSYLRNNLVNLPLWLNEGLAEYYSVTRIDRGTAEIGRPKGLNSAWCREHTMLPIAELFAFTGDSPDYLRATDRRHTFYAESWLLIHHLLQSTTENARRFEAFMLSLRRGEDPERAFAQVITRDRWDDLLAEVGRDNQGATRYASYDFRGDFNNEYARSATMRRAEILFRLGDLALHSETERYERAEAHFRAALDHDPTHAASVAALGYLADLRGRSREAEAQYVRALWLPGDDSRPCLIAGLGTMHRFFAANPGPVVVRDSVPPLMRKIRERFACALERDPGNPEALAGYGETFTYQLVPTREAIDALERAAAALPTRTDVLVDLVVLYANAGGRAAAEALLHGTLEPRLSAERTRRLEARILEADRRLSEVRGNLLIREGVALFNARRHAEARTKLVAALDFPLSATTEAYVRRLIREIDAFAREER